mmetsp:Transcript_99446/g.197058  ORF Transcript_99446/g.197058 Transcript_99446/m.197058 type:complete len:98 (-) Transcript_99446:3-296(-)
MSRLCCQLLPTAALPTSRQVGHCEKGRLARHLRDQLTLGNESRSLQRVQRLQVTVVSLQPWHTCHHQTLELQKCGASHQFHIYRLTEALHVTGAKMA